MALIAVPLTIVVLLLLSSEKPIALTDWLEQVVATAERVNSGATVAPLVGLLTVGLANAEIAQAASKERAREDLLNKNTGSLSIF